MAAITITHIISMAVGHLLEQPVMSDSDNRPSVKLMKRDFATAKESLLRCHEWNFATDRALLNPLSEAPAFGWRYAYSAPADCLYLIPLTEGGRLEGRLVPYEYERRRILTNATGPLPVRYVAEVDEGEFTADFAKALALDLAWRVAHAITGKQGMLDMIYSLSQDALKKAKQTDAKEGGTVPRPQGTDWMDARFGGRTD